MGFSAETWLVWLSLVVSFGALVAWLRAAGDDWLGPDGALDRVNAKRPGMAPHGPAQTASALRSDGART